MEHKNNSEAIWPNDVMRAIDSVLKTNFESWDEVLEGIVDDLRFEWDASKWIPTYTIIESLGLLWKSEDQFNKITSLIAFVEKNTKDVQYAEKNFMKNRNKYLSIPKILEKEETILEYEEEIKKLNKEKSLLYEKQISGLEEVIDLIRNNIQKYKANESTSPVIQRCDEIFERIARLESQVDQWEGDIQKKLRADYNELTELSKVSSYTMLKILNHTLENFPEEMQTRYQHSKDLWQNFWETK